MTTSAVVLATTISGGTAHGVALAVPSPADSASDMTALELAQAQSPAYNLASRIAIVAGYADNDDSAGYARVRFDVGTNTVDLWWKGALDPQVQTLISSAKSSGTTVTIHAATHTRAFMAKRAKLLFSNPDLQAQGVHIQAATMPDDMSGFDIVIRNTGTAFAERSAAANRVGPASGFPMHSVSEGSTGASVVTPAVAVTRQSDTAPWSAGGEMISTQYTDHSGTHRNYCSTGFAVNDYGTQSLLSAAHCDYGDLNTPNPVEEYLGWYNGQYTVLAHHTDTRTSAAPDDSMVMDTVGSTSPSMYGGIYNSSYIPGVSGTNANIIGAFVRTSGANSGQHNDIKITAVDQDYVCPASPSQVCVNGVFAELGAHGNGSIGNVAVVDGDSGGPVYTRVAATDTRVYAQGEIVGGLPGDAVNQAACNSYALSFPGPHLCWTGVAYADIQGVLSGWGGDPGGGGFTLMTTP
jgi:hypothetical protein